MTTLKTTPAPTFDDVWRIIQELANTQKKTERSFKETERNIKEADLRYRAMRDEFAREAKERDDKAAREAIKAAHEAKDRDDKTDRLFKTVNKQIGDLGGRLGQFVEEMVRPAAVRLFRQRGLDVHQVMKNLTAYDDFGQYRSEVDLLVINNKTAIAVECKSNLSIDDVNEHLERLNIFKDCFPQYAEFSLLGAVAAMVIPDDVGRYAYKQGLFVIAQNGETMLIRNDDKFNPQTW